MNILVLGGSGFIGTNLIKSKINDNIINIDLKQNQDIISFDFNTLPKIDRIYNLACYGSPIQYQKNPLHTINTNLAIQRVCEFALKRNIPLLHSSTSEIYGNPLLTIQDESYFGNVNPIGPRSCYDEGKRIAETILYEYSKLGLNIKLVRIFNTYGPYLNDERVISTFLKQARNNEDITIFGDGNQTRSFLYIDDLLEGFELLFNKDYEFQPINLGNPNEYYTINQVAELIIKLTNSKSKIIHTNLPQDDPVVRKPDITKAITFGFNPKITLEEGILKC